jgi:hypothetical protein
VRRGKPPGSEEKDDAREERSRQADKEARPEEGDGAERCREHEPIGGEKAPKEKAQGHRDLRPIEHRL